VPPQPVNHRELLRHQPDLQHATAYPRPQTQHDLQPPGRTEMLNRDHTQSETPPIPTATPLTIGPRWLHYINSGPAWFAGTFCRHTNAKGMTAWETHSRLGPLNNRGLNLLTHTTPGEGPRPPPRPPAHGGVLGPPRAHARARARARARALPALTPTAHCPGPGPPMDGPPARPVPGDGPFLPT
jgi:hypothetical protein